MLKPDGNGGTRIDYSLKHALTILSILIILAGAIGFFVRGASGLEFLDSRVTKIEEKTDKLNEDFVPRIEMDTRDKLTGEQLNRLEGKIDTLNNKVDRLIEK